MGRTLLGLLLAATSVAPANAGIPENGGPYNASFLPGGVGIERALRGAEPMVRAGATYTLSAWVRSDALQKGRITLIALGGGDGPRRALALNDGRLELIDGERRISDGTRLAADRWTHVAAVFDGTSARLYVDGRPRGRPLALRSAQVAPQIGIAPVVRGEAHFGGAPVQGGADDQPCSARAVHAAAANPPKFDLVQMGQVGVGL